MGSAIELVADWCALPAAWVGVTAIVAFGTMLGGIQLVFAILMVSATPILRRCFLLVVRHIYPTRVGKIHIWFMLFIRRYWLRGKRHTQPIRIDFHDRTDRPSRNTPASQENSVDGSDAEPRPRASVHVVSGLIDNYTYVIVERTSLQDRETNSGALRPLRCCVVDPGDADATIEALQYIREQHYNDGTSEESSAGSHVPVTVDVALGREASTARARNTSPTPARQRTSARSSQGDEDDLEPLIVTAIFVTHKHWDHQAGVRKVVERERINTKRAHARHPGAFPLSTIEVIAGQHERGVQCCTRRVGPGDYFKLGNLTFEIIPSPCHTKGHIMFALLAKDANCDTLRSMEPGSGSNDVHALFTGDTLFCGGCGAPFEGSSHDMAANFRSIYHRCGDSTLLFPGHEYSEHLLLEYFGGSQPTPWAPHQYSSLCHALQRARDSRSHRRPSVPILLGAELMYNSHFSSLHKAAATVCESWRIFARTVNARAASEEAIVMLRESTQRADVAGSVEAQQRLRLANFLESSFRKSKKNESSQPESRHSNTAAHAAPASAPQQALPRAARPSKSSSAGAPPAADFAAAAVDDDELMHQDYHQAASFEMFDDQAISAPLTQMVELAAFEASAPDAAAIAPAAAESPKDLVRSIGPVRRTRAARRYFASSSEPASYAVRHRVKVKRKWRAGELVTIEVSGIELECRIPEGLRPDDVFAIRIPRDRLPRLLCYTPQDFCDPISTVWHRDLERLHSLTVASSTSPEALRRATTLSRALLNSPLRDVRNYDDLGSSVVSNRKTHTLLPRAHYRGPLDEVSAQQSAEARADNHVRTATWREPPARSELATAFAVDAEIDRALSCKRRAPESFLRLQDFHKENHGSNENDWRNELRPATTTFVSWPASPLDRSLAN